MLRLTKDSVDAFHKMLLEFSPRGLGAGNSREAGKDDDGVIPNVQYRTWHRRISNQHEM